VRIAFLHGAGCTADVFGAQVRGLEDARAIRLPGHDGADEGPATIAAFADAVEHQLEPAPEGTLLCGHSMGGAIALEIGLRGRAGIRGLVLLGSGAKLRVAPAIFELLERDFAAGARALAESYFAQPRSDRIETAVAQMLFVGQAQTVRDFRACDAFDTTGRLAALPVPLLAITGANDALTPPKFAQFLADRVPVGSARILDEAGHFAMVERPEETNALIRAFAAQMDLG
jgi:pimeloyl-ACP methyl ester carboxylesterase